MQPVKRPDLRNIAHRAGVRLDWLAGTFFDARSVDKEVLLAGMEFERGLIDGCREARFQSP